MPTHKVGKRILAWWQIAVISKKNMWEKIAELHSRRVEAMLSSTDGCAKKASGESFTHA